MGEPEWANGDRFCSNESRVANQDELDRAIESWTTERTPHQVMATLQALGVPAGAVQNASDKVNDDPQLRARQFLPEVDHPELGRNKVEAIPVKLSRSPWELRTASPLLGEHSDYVYRQVLGLTESEIVELREEGRFNA